MQKGLVVVLALVLLFNYQVMSQGRDSLDIKIGQMLLIGFPGTQVDTAVLEEVRNGKVGSIIIFEKNIPPTNSFVALKKITWTYQQAAPIPLFVTIDQEGGKVNRLKSKYGFPNSITAAAMAKATSLDSVRFYGESTASTLAGLGININFAPVVDLSSNPTNPIIAKHGRAFSANEDSVILMATEFIKQHRKYGVLTSLKHFPGHGSSKDDTHLGIADVTNTWEERELKPYQALIDSGYVDAVMTSHIVNKRLEPDGHPGTLSDDVITGILRNRLHFNGVVFTDDMQMHAITKHYGLEEAIKLAILAGVDIMTFSNNISGSDQRTVDKVHGIIRSMVQNGTISESRIDESFRRIMKLKAQLGAKDVTASLKESLAKTQSELAAAQNSVKENRDKREETGKKKKKKSKKNKS
ncbi:glycoside hydrolase family 3 protein [Chryseosolibacter indicus]|uniref:beta-N-acetylhexosaminidase n=1 Tax=Chryseosolibacter indicus TaxID=2782351 RepID=A0ABS5VQ02_9BACT|nr:glycoside hydrolase family 3 N-terminal domain-containing protein [Chryseosolibacter indicus]MBT1703103.1 glycoside hydrolase family 3 protein [Chryseosolibacter indicus]